MRESLFRPELRQAQSTRWLSPIRIGRLPNCACLMGIAVLLLAGLPAFALRGEVSLQARVPDVLLPTGGLNGITAPQAGTVVELLVNEGEEVQAAQPLLKIRTARRPQGDTALLNAQALAPRRRDLQIRVTKPQRTIRAAAVFVYYIPAGGEWARSSPQDESGIYGPVRDLLLSHGIAVVSAQPWGLHCEGSLSEPSEGGCFDADVTQRLRLADWLPLLQAQVRTAQELAPDAPLVFVTFSGATLPFSRWLETQSTTQLTKVSWIGLSPLLTSPREAWHWQKQGALLEEAGAIFGGDLTVDCLSEAVAKLSDRLRRFFPDDAAGWTTSLCQGGGLQALESVLSQRFSHELAQTLAASGPVTVQAPEGALVLDAHYLAEVFAGTEAPAQQLRRLEERAALIFGERDISLSPGHQRSAWLDSSTASVTVLKDVGHSFGADGYAGRPGAAFVSAVERALDVLGVSDPAKRRVRGSSGLLPALDPPAAAWGGGHLVDGLGRVSSLPLPSQKDCVY